MSKEQINKKESLLEKILKKDLYNYISSILDALKKKLKLVFIIILAILVIVLILLSTKISLDQNLFYYIFSTIAQSFASLVGFLGAVVLYKLQIIENSLNSIAENLKYYIKQIDGSKSESYSYLEVKGFCEKMLNTFPGDENIKMHLLPALDKINEELKTRSFIRNKMVDFAIISFFNIFIALIGLIFSRFVFIDIFPSISASFGIKQVFFMVYVLFNIFISVLCLFYAFRVIKRAVGYSYTVEIVDKIKVTDKTRVENESSIKHR